MNGSSQNTSGVISHELQEQIDDFADRLAASGTSSCQDDNTRLSGSLAVAMATVAILKRIVSQATWQSASELMHILRSEGRLMVARAGVNDMIVGNLIRRVIKLVREDYHSALLHPDSLDASNIGAGGTSRDSELLQHATSQVDEKATEVTAGHNDGDPPDSLHGYMAGSGIRQAEEYTKCVPDLGDRISQSIDELSGELETSADEIADQGNNRTKKNLKL